ncbi:MAG: DUF4214 domain-containing protein [Thiovulaceae bacterium]|nr:DUF4214 domain-containing protein [Sulfurimonadaceae bacterium]
MATLINGLGGAEGFGENSVYRNDDGYSNAIDISSIFPNGINLFGNVYNSMYVNTNGNVTFDGGLYSYTPGVIGANTTSPIIAPFWADVDTRAGVVAPSTGTVNVDYSLNAYRAYLNNDTLFYNTTTTSSALSNYDITSYVLSSYTSFQTSAETLTGISNPTQEQLSVFQSYYTFLQNAQEQIDAQTGSSNYNPAGNSQGSDLVWYDLNPANQTITVTWDDVGYYYEHIDKTNAFQLQIVNTGNGNFDMSFIYEDINWTTGDASGGVNGLGGTVARAGYSAGDGIHYLEFPYSGDQASMLNLENNFFSSETAPGVWKLSSQGGSFAGIGLENSNDTLIGTALADYMDGRSGDDTLYGGTGDDTLNGGDGNDVLNGGDGNDYIFGGPGSNTIDGGSGTDTVAYQGNLNHYSFLDALGAFSVTDDAQTLNDNLHNVENLRFNDTTISQGDILPLINLEQEVTRLYTALLGRTPDNAGLIYWLNDINTNGNTIQGASGAFAGSEEYLTRFGAQSDTAFINQLYNNILGRNADQAGYNYWIDEITHTGDRTGMIVSFSNSNEYIQDQATVVGTYVDNVNLNGYTTT